MHYKKQRSVQHKVPPLHLSWLDALFDIEEADSFDLDSLPSVRSSHEIPHRGTAALWLNNPLLKDVVFDTTKHSSHFPDDKHSESYELGIRDLGSGYEMELAVQVNSQIDYASVPVDDLYPYELLYPDSRPHGFFNLALPRVWVRASQFCKVPASIEVQQSSLQRGIVAYLVTVPGVIVISVDVDDKICRFAFMSMPENDDLSSFRLTGIGKLGIYRLGANLPVTCSFDMGTVTRDNIPILEQLCVRWLLGMDAYIDSYEYNTDLHRSGTRALTQFGTVRQYCANCEVSVNHFSSSSIDRLLVLNDHYCTVCEKQLTNPDRHRWANFRAGMG